MSGTQPAGGALSAAPEAVRGARVAALLGEREIDALVVDDPVNVRYLTGFTGSSGLALIAGAGRQADHQPYVFVTDFRYATQSAEQVPAPFVRRVVTADPFEGVAGELGVGDHEGSDAGAGGGRLGFDEATLTVKRHGRLRELLGAAWELVPCGGVVGELRELKEPAELARVRAAAELADAALRQVLEAGVVGRTEREVAIDLELRMRRLGAQGPSFPSIVAGGRHSALPHAEPREVPIERDTLLTIDWGAVHEGYCSDCTRTFATGEHLPEDAVEVYELVLYAQLQALAALMPGPSGREIDAVAREVIEEAGHGEHFGHGLGHGVGMEVHEGPRLSRTAGEQALRAGNVVTVEPGVYIPGRFGVRIEDLAVLTPGGHQVLSGLSKELTVLA